MSENSEYIAELHKEHYELLVDCQRKGLSFVWQYLFKKGSLKFRFLPGASEDFYDLLISSDLTGFDEGLSEYADLTRNAAGEFAGTFPLTVGDFISDQSPIMRARGLLLKVPDKEKKKGQFLYWVGQSSAQSLLEATKLVSIEISKNQARQMEVFGAIPAVCIGSAGYPLETEDSVFIYSNQDALVFNHREGGESFEVGFKDIDSLEFEGGEYERGGGFSGGGFGLAGFAIGAVSSMALNKLTTKTGIETLIKVLTVKGEINLFTNYGTPQELEIKLVDVRTGIRNANRLRPGISVGQSEGDNLTTQLAKLAELHRSGVLSDEEFQGAKSKLLNL
jgi:hypothetical protein